MNLHAFLNRGAAHAPKPIDPIVKAAEDTRKQWLNALLVDQTRTWMSLDESEPDVLSAMATMLAIAGFAHVYDARRSDTPDLRIIRGAISAITQCSAEGSVITADHARAFSSAAQRAVSIIEVASVEAIVHAAKSIRETVGLT